MSLTVELDEGDAGTEIASTVDAAALAWEQCLRQLPEALDVAVTARFAALPCDGEKLVAARANTAYARGRDGLLRPAALEAYRNGSRVAVEEGLSIELNGALVAPSTCAGVRWSLEASEDGVPVSSDSPELFAAVQHELGHLLGLDVGYDLFEPPDDAVSVYLTRLVSKVHGVALSELDTEQLRSAVTTPRNVVWTGALTRALAATRLEPGVPEMYLQSRALPSDISSELLGSNFLLASRGNGDAAPVVGRLTRVDEACGVHTSRQGQVALIHRPSCGVAAAVTNLVRDGVAVAIVEGVDTSERLPTFPIPVVVSSERYLSDVVGELEGQDVLFRINDARLQGADSSGNVYVHTPVAYDAAVSLVHLDRATLGVAKPTYPTSNVPELGSGIDPTCGLSLSMLLDLGYAKPACGDGAVGPDEACDDGSANSDVRPDACRLSCQLPSCGDGVIDQGEACDDGLLNSAAADACRPGCVLPRCGDGVVDIARGERCDEGESNADAQGAGCRTSCLPGRCGDGVVDDDEACDDGADNSNERSNVCRADCTLPRCGDGVVDGAYGETCDDGNTVGDPWCDARCREHGDESDAGIGAVTEHSGADAGPAPQSFHDAGVTDRTTTDAGNGAPERLRSSSSGCQCALGARSRSPYAPLGLGVVGVLYVALRRRCRVSRRRSRAAHSATA